MTKFFRSIYSLSGLLTGLLVLVAGVGRAQAQERVYPAGANVLNVKVSCGVKGDGVTDDAPALQAAFDQYSRQGRTFYFPNGTYLISRPLYWNGSGGNAAAFSYLQGQSQAGVIIRLQDNAPAFQNAGAPVAMLRTAPQNNGDTEQSFANSLRDLTFHTGNGNPGAIGLQFYANNQGIAERLSIISGDGQGPTGLDFAFLGGDGPLMVRNVYIKGFDVGVRLQYGYGIVMEDITVEGQRKYGLYSDGGRTYVRRFTSTNAVPAVYSNFGGGSRNNLLLLDANITGTGAASGQTAIIQDGFGLMLYLRNVNVTGYARVTTTTANTQNPSPPLGLVSEYTTFGGYYSNFNLSQGSLKLPIKDVPTVAWGDPNQDWANVNDYGADPSGRQDATAAIQAAIDAGKPVVYFPSGSNYRITGTVLIRGAVQRLMGLGCFFSSGLSNNNQAPVSGFRLVDAPGAPATVVMEQFMQSYDQPMYIQQVSATRTLSVQSMLGFQFESNAAGDLLLTDVTSRLILNAPGASVWARQFNLEYTTVTNAGAKLWVLGMKTEAQENGWIKTTSGGFTELLGSFIYTSQGQPTGAMFTNDNSNVSYVNVVKGRDDNNYPSWVQETRNGETRNLPLDAGAVMNYSSFDPNALQAPAAPTITGLAPASGPVGTVVTVTGTNLTGATALTLNGAAVSGFTVASATSLTFTVPAGASSGPVAVITPGGTATSATAFTVVAPNPVPTISSLSPSSTVAGSPDFTLTVTGTGFGAGSALSFNGNALATTLASATQLTATVPASAVAAAGAYSVTVANPAPGGGTSAAATFTVTVPVPTISSFSPASGGPGTLVTVTGTNLTGATTVSLGTGSVSQFTVASATSLTFTVPTGASSGLISLTTPGGTASSATAFTVTAPLAATASAALPALRVYPNPVHDLLRVELPGAAPATVGLRDVLGRAVLTPRTLPAGGGQLALPAGLAAGVYLLEVEQAGTRAVRRVAVK